MEEKRTRGKDKKKRKQLEGEAYEKRNQNLAKARKNGITSQTRPLEGEDIEYSKKLILFTKDIEPKEELDRNDIEEMERRFSNYLDKCIEWGIKPANMSAYFAIGINDSIAYEWDTMRSMANKEKHVFIKKVKQICALYRESMANDGKINPVIYIFQAKNYDGMRDQAELVVTPKQQFEEVDADRLQKKYLDNAIDGEIIDVKETSE